MADQGILSNQNFENVIARYLHYKVTLSGGIHVYNWYDMRIIVFEIQIYFEQYTRESNAQM